MCLSTLLFWSYSINRDISSIVIHVPYTFPLGTTKQLVLELIPSYEQVIRPPMPLELWPSPSTASTTAS